ncbi:hypothetical protein [Microbacterium sp. KR10-403]|uniref:hypothetical protein n=1 Tax=Microbacterium sp. KR10-403 TaxID=3158581 RepID=UPI0032E4BBAB
MMGKQDEVTELVEVPPNTILFGYPCRNCGRPTPMHFARSMNVVTESSLIAAKETTGWRCGFCNHLQYVGHDPEGARALVEGRKPRGGRRRDRFAGLKKSYKRETQLRSSDGHVHYGMIKNLAKRGFTIPEGFSGNSDALAQAIGASHSELAAAWKVSETELRQRGTFDLSD